MALQRCIVIFFARFLGWILEGEFWEVNFLRVNFLGGLICWKNRMKNFDPRIRVFKVRLPEFGFRRCKIPCAEICPWTFHAKSPKPISGISMVFPLILVDFQSILIDFVIFNRFNQLQSISVNFNQFQISLTRSKHRNWFTTGRWGKQHVTLVFCFSLVFSKQKEIPWSFECFQLFFAVLLRFFSSVQKVLNMLGVVLGWVP